MGASRDHERSTGSPVDSPAAILRAAADLIAPEGRWTQGEYEAEIDGHACHCALGAILKVQKAPPTSEDENEACRAFAKGVVGTEEPHLVARWNDAKGRTQAEVVAKLREVADKLDAEAAR